MSRRNRATLVLIALAIVAPAAAVVSVRAQDCTVAVRPSWKPRVEFPYDSFQHEAGLASTSSTWIKLTILDCDPDAVYFQDSNAFTFHFDFATQELDPLRGLTREEFDRITLHAEGQEAVLGAVIYPRVFGAPFPQEFGIQLVRHDPYGGPELVAILERITAAVDAPEGVRAFYFPTFEQEASARENEDLLRSHGFELSSAARWAADDVVYAPGWAIGRLRFVPADDIDPAYRRGELRAGDILLTDGIPAEIPFVAGILSLRPATPSSHVAILAGNFGVPFAHLVRPADRDRARTLDGRRVILRAHPDASSPDVRLLDVEDQLDEATTAELLALKDLPPLAITRKETRGEYFLPVAGLGLGDSRYAGGKASNYALLLEAIPERVRPAGVFTFDLWDAFLDQPFAGGRTLRDEVDARLAPFDDFPPADAGALFTALEGVQELFQDDDLSHFSSELRDAILTALSDERLGFDPEQKIRFRSSTNVEDAEQFTGAGLYESFSGCLADDLDGDDLGPSACDSTSEKERGVLRAIRRVFASFYNANAFLERRRWKVDEDDVGMAVLVHHSFPDETELANGVATLSIDSFERVKFVSQPEAVSVTNPDETATPEVVVVDFFTGGKSARLEEHAGLLVLGETVLEWKSEYFALADLCRAVAGEYRKRLGAVPLELDFEYKKIEGEGLVLKQVRRLPVATGGGAVTPFLVNEPMTLETFEGESSHFLSIQRLKSTWELETRNMWLTPENLAGGLYSTIHVEATDGCTVFELGGPGFPANAVHSHDGTSATTRFELADLPNPRTYTLVTGPVPLSVPSSVPPVFTQRDFFSRFVTVEHESEVLGPDEQGGVGPVRNESITIVEELEPSDSDILAERIVEDGDVRVEIAFYWPPPPAGPVAGYTAPLVRWVETRITGLTSEPLVLHGEYSQTYRPEHHNFAENFFFVPSLDPEVSATALAELREEDVHAIHVLADGGASQIKLYGARELGETCHCDPVPRGDVNADGHRDLSDGIYLLRYLFADGPPPLVPSPRADLNADGKLDISDPVFLFRFLFLGGESPPVDCEP